MNDQIFPAATLILIRDAPGLEALMVERHAATAFGGALVFPGGRIVEADADPAWRDYAEGLSDDPSVGAAQIAAVRETFEEIGLLLAAPMADGDPRSSVQFDNSLEVRVDIERNPDKFLTLIAQNRLKLSCDALLAFSRWITPPSLPKRFDTYFFVAAAPGRIEISPDGREAVGADWYAPDKALSMGASGERKVVFPTARNLELLGMSDTVQRALEAATMRDVRPILPELAMRNGEMCVTIPEDLGYPVTAEPTAKAHRR